MKKQVFSFEDSLPLIAILRGIEAKNCIRITQILIEEGFSMIEVPLNSPNALQSIAMLVKEFGNDFLIGAGTVTTLQKAEAVIETGANLVVTPNVDVEVIKCSSDAGCITFPGVATPSEAFLALASGATGLKLFPIQSLGIEGFKALKSVLPSNVICLPVGGINANSESMKPYLDIGANGFGIGSSLYKPEMSDADIRENARLFRQAFEMAKDK